MRAMTAFFLPTATTTSYCPGEIIAAPPTGRKIFDLRAMMIKLIDRCWKEEHS